MNVHTCIATHTYMHVRISLHTPIYMYMYSCTCINTCTYEDIYLCSAYACARSYLCIYVHIHVFTHTACERYIAVWHRRTAVHGKSSNNNNNNNNNNNKPNKQKEGKPRAVVSGSDPARSAGQAGRMTSRAKQVATQLSASCSRKD